MNSKHTPGPWTAIKATYSDDRGTNDFWHVAYTDRGKTWSMKTAGDEGRANAYLIAAAPALLAACKAMLDAADGSFWDDDGITIETVRAEETIEQLRAAIAAAEGGA